jgi:hypothetical protein
MKLTGLQTAYSPGFPPSVAGEIRAETEALAVELDKPGVIIEDWLPDPALAGDGQFADELFSMPALAAEAPGPRSDEPGSGPVRDYLAALGRRDRFMAAWDRLLAPCDVFLIPAMPMCA